MFRARSAAFAALTGFLSALNSTVVTGAEATATPVMEVARSQDSQWTGVAVTRDTPPRIFVNYPYWYPRRPDEVPISVAEVLVSSENPSDPSTATVRPYPDEAWNSWRPGKPPQVAFVCVQSVHVDADNNLWILDPANPKFEGVIEGGPKLIQVDPETDEVVRIYDFRTPEDSYRANSYLNDVRIDTQKRLAFITDSGSGALVVLDLNSGRSRRLLEDHESVRGEAMVLTIGDHTWQDTVHADSIALSPDRAHLYYKPLTGRTLYRVATASLAAAMRSDYEPGGADVTPIAETGATDGIEFGSDGRLYLTAIEESAITRLVDNQPAGIETVVEDKDLLEWPDSFAVDADGSLYVTTSQIHRRPPSRTERPPGPFRLFRFKPVQ